MLLLHSTCLLNKSLHVHTAYGLSHSTAGISVLLQFGVEYSFFVKSGCGG